MRCPELVGPLETDDPQVHHYCNSGNIFVKPGPLPECRPGLYAETADRCSQGQWCDVQHVPRYTLVHVLPPQRR